MAVSEPMIGGTQACGEERVINRRRWLLPFFRRPRSGLAARLALYVATLGTVVTAVLTSHEAKTDIVRSHEGHANFFIFRPIDFAGFLRVVHAGRGLPVHGGQTAEDGVITPRKTHG